MDKESDNQLAERMRKQAAIQCRTILDTNDTIPEMLAKAWMGGATWMLYELRPPGDYELPT
jgi:hypothetical protein